MVKIEIMLLLVSGLFIQTVSGLPVGSPNHKKADLEFTISQRLNQARKYLATNPDSFYATVEKLLIGTDISMPLFPDSLDRLIVRANSIFLPDSLLLDKDNG